MRKEMKYTKIVKFDVDAGKKEIKAKQKEVERSLPKNIINPKWKMLSRLYPYKIAYMLRADIT